ncbi:uncharacterized protein LOC135494372 [Lineus longissimus]|uniref:uncharacterized protein LOC135494372 n=1 Tax=Lineus longissimus TaxID=88925 RepID=UPI00315C7C5E
MADDKRWCRGPDFLWKGEEEWPRQVMESLDVSGATVSEVAMGEEKKEANSAVAQVSTPVLPAASFSSWTRYRRMVAWMLCFAKKLPKRKDGMRSFTPDELRQAEIGILRDAQRQVFKSEMLSVQKSEEPFRGSLRDLCPMIDDDGLLRVGGRLEKSDLPYDAQHPIILPKNHPVTTLIIRSFHLLAYHVRGVNGLLADIRTRYWPVNGREAVKKYELTCVKCKERKKKLYQQKMASLPGLRVKIPIRAFAHCGVDYGGPYLVKVTRKMRDKRYLCLFTCLASRAVHLEVAFGLDTASFLNALSRMTARRGRPQVMVSDNGTNFRSADRELRELVNELDQERITNHLAEKGIEWRFNPPLGAHHGGVFEIMIKAAKKGLKAILGEAVVNDEEFSTAVAEVEGLLNARPITYCGQDPKDENVLTPNSF